MPANSTIKLRQGSSAQWNIANPVLANGEPGWDTTNGVFKIGNGLSNWNDLPSVNYKVNRGSFLLTSSSGTFNVSGGYTVGSLDVFLNGIKLSSSGDYIATNGSSFSLTDPAPSGSLVEYLSMAAGSFPVTTSNQITDFNSSVSGLLPVTNIVPGTNVTVSNNSGAFTINSIAAGISNSGVNRLFVSDGSSSGIVGQANLTFDGSLLNVTGSGSFSSGINTSTLDITARYTEKVLSTNIVSSGLTLNLSSGNLFITNLNSNISSVTITGVPVTSGVAVGFSLIFTADGTARSVTWPSGIKWAAGTAPTLTSINTKRDFFSFISTNNGIDYLGFVGGQNY